MNSKAKQPGAENVSQEAFGQSVNRAAALIQQGKPETATELLRELLRVQPDNPMVLHLMGIGHRRAGLLDQAMDVQHALLKNNPTFAAAYQELGLCLQSAGKSAEALQMFSKATELDARLVNSWKFLGDTALQTGDVATAQHAYRQYPANGNEDPMYSRALELIKGQNMGLADIVIRQYLKLNPGDARAWHQQSRIALHFGAVTEAMELLKTSLQLDGRNTAARFEYANLLSRRQRYAEAQREIRALLASEPENQTYQLFHAAVLDRSGQYAEAAEILQSILREKPAQASVWTGLAMLQRTMGQTAEAIASLHKAIDHDPERGEAWYLLADMKTFKFSDAQVEAMRRTVERAPKGSEDEMYFNFALGHALEVRDEIEASFAAYARGNAIKAQSSAFKPDAWLRQIEAIEDHVTPELFERLSGAGCTDTAPIFIVGLPRSGSTLVEQILTSHSQVDGTMELAHLSTAVKEFNFRRQKSQQPVYPQGLAHLSAEECRQIGEEYIQRSQILRGSAPYFVDKMPNNFEHIGLIHLALPNTRIIDVRRDAMANGFSAFRQVFRAGQEWSYRLADIGLYIRGYKELMRHWDEVLPGKVLRVNYEELVSDPEPVIRSILQHVQLPFEDACLQPQANTRAVRTASSEQVRQPIHGNAVDQWKRYEGLLKPLSDALAGS